MTERHSNDDSAADEVMRAPTPEVVRSLVGNHREWLQFLERRVGNRDIAEDILQEAFARGVDRIETLRNEESVVAWFYRTLRNAVVDHFRRRGSAERALAAVAAEFEEAVEPDFETKNAVCQCVRELATTLKPEYATALQRVEVDGLSVQAFAEEASITPNNAAVRLFRAREALRKRVATSCGTCAEHGCLDCSCAPTSGAVAKHGGGCGHGPARSS
jgi:RNA polymerase sigma factor (sigma-70 family)